MSLSKLGFTERLQRKKILINWMKWKKKTSFRSGGGVGGSSYSCDPLGFMEIHLIFQYGFPLLNTNAYHQVLLLPGRWSRSWAQPISLSPSNSFVICPLPQPGELYPRVGVGKPYSFASYVLSNLCSKSWILSSSLRSQTFETQKSKRSSAFWCHIPFSRQWH